MHEVHCGRTCDSCLSAQTHVTASGFDHLAWRQRAVTDHLKVLEEANLVAVLWSGREKLHYLNSMPIHDIAERCIGKFERGRLRLLADLKKR